MSLLRVTAPLVIRHPDGERHILAERFPHPEGLLYFEPFWPVRGASAVHVARGEVRGDGPWKIGAAVVSVLGCHGSDPDLAGDYAEWQSYRQTCGDDYPDEKQLHELARTLGALPQDVENGKGI